MFSFLSLQFAMQPTFVFMAQLMGAAAIAVVILVILGSPVTRTLMSVQKLHAKMVPPALIKLTPMPVNVRPVSLIKTVLQI